MITAVPTTDLITQLTALVASMLTTCKVHLYTAVAAPIGPGTVIGDFTEADYTGYAAQTAAFGDPYLDSENRAVSDSPLIQFQPTGDTVTNTVLGFYVTDSGSTDLLWCGEFDSPKSMLSPTDAIPIVLQYKLAPPVPE